MCVFLLNEMKTPTLTAALTVIEKRSSILILYCRAGDHSVVLSTDHVNKAFGVCSGCPSSLKIVSEGDPIPLF